MRRFVAICVAVATVATLCWSGSKSWVPARSSADRDQPKVQSYQAFNTWLAENPRRGDEFADLSAYLSRRGVGQVVPVWTLTRGDANRLRQCDGAGFMLPPRRLWPNIVPALELVRDQVVPAVGKVVVVSVYRSGSLNRCAHGATRSRHLRFAALDLVARDEPDSREVFKKLCSAWQGAGKKSAWGFGAYFDPDRPTANKRARFHVDGAGYRSWGFSTKSASSGCRLIGGSDRLGGAK